MKISTRLRYGLRAMIDLALDEDVAPVMTQAIADRQEVSKKYLEHLLKSLKDAGLVRSVRGSKGGFYLARSPEEITVEDVALAFEGSPEIVDCVGNPEVCSRREQCPTIDLWREMGDVIFSFLRTRTLADMKKLAVEKKASTAPMFHI